MINRRAWLRQALFLCCFHKNVNGNGFIMCEIVKNTGLFQKIIVSFLTVCFEKYTKKQKKVPGGKKLYDKKNH